MPPIWLAAAALLLLANAAKVPASIEITVIAGDEENEDAVLAHEVVEIPRKGMEAYYAMRKSSIAMDAMELGGKSVVMGIAGVRSRLPKTGWILEHTHAGHAHPNVNLGEIHVRPGDALLWRLMALGTQPSPEPLAMSAADSFVEEEEEVEEAEEEAASELDDDGDL